MPVTLNSLVWSIILSPYIFQASIHSLEKIPELPRWYYTSFWDIKETAVQMLLNTWILAYLFHLVENHLNLSTISLQWSGCQPFYLQFIQDYSTKEIGTLLKSELQTLDSTRGNLGK